MAMCDGYVIATFLNSLPPSESDAALLVVMRRVMETGEGGYWVGVLLMASAIAAMMSTADSGLVT